MANKAQTISVPVEGWEKKRRYSGSLVSMGRFVPQHTLAPSAFIHSQGQDGSAVGFWSGCRLGIPGFGLTIYDSLADFF